MGSTRSVVSRRERPPPDLLKPSLSLRTILALLELTE